MYIFKLAVQLERCCSIFAYNAFGSIWISRLTYLPFKMRNRLSFFSQNRSTFTAPKAHSLIVPCSHQCDSAMTPPQPIESHQCKGDVREIAIKALVPKLIVFAGKKKMSTERVYSPSQLKCQINAAVLASAPCGVCTHGSRCKKTGPYSQQSC